MATTTTERTEKGVSLARGPALILGTILEVAGPYFLYKQHTFPPTSNFPNGSAPVPGKVFLGIFGVNGWSGLLTAAAGGLLLFGAAQHLLAKTTSLIVGVALGAAAIIAVVSGNVLGLAAANGWTRLGWGVCAVILLFNTMVPRRRRTVTEPAGYDERSAGRAGAVPMHRDRAAAPATSAAAAESESARGDRTEPLVTRDRGEGARDDRLANDETGATAVHRAGPADDRGAGADTVDDPGTVADDRSAVTDTAETRRHPAGE
jgi:hypothetical protein